jgi:hypothetical protein
MRLSVAKDLAEVKLTPRSRSVLLRAAVPTCSPFLLKLVANAALKDRSSTLVAYFSVTSLSTSSE